MSKTEEKSSSEDLSLRSRTKETKEAELKELKERAVELAAQAAQPTEAAVKEFKEEVEKTSKKRKKAKETGDTLVSADQYLASGIHIGTQRKIKDMRRFIFKVRSDGLAILDVATIDKRVRVLAKFLANFAPEKVLVVSGKSIGKKAVQEFCEITGCIPIITRFMPGSLTNPAIENYVEPDLVFVVDPSSDRQAIQEARKMNVPIVALCDTNNMTQNIDFIAPLNNRGKKSIALLFWILAREMLKIKGKIQGDDEFQHAVEDFEAPETKEEKAEAEK